MTAGNFPEGALGDICLGMFVNKSHGNWKDANKEWKKKEIKEDEERRKQDSSIWSKYLNGIVTKCWKSIFKVNYGRETSASIKHANCRVDFKINVVFSFSFSWSVGPPVIFCPGPLQPVGPPLPSLNSPYFSSCLLLRAAPGVWLWWWFWKSAGPARWSRTITSPDE